MTHSLSPNTFRRLVTVAVTVAAVHIVAAFFGAYLALRYGVEQTELGLLYVISVAVASALVALIALAAESWVATFPSGSQRKKEVLQLCAVALIVSTAIAVSAWWGWLSLV